MPRPFTTPRRYAALLIAVLLVALGVPMVAQTAGGPEATGQAVFFTSSGNSLNSTSSAFSLTAGRIAALPTTAKPLAATTARWRGLEVSAYGRGAAGTTFDYKLWTYKRSNSTSGGTTDDYTRQLYCYGTCTLGTGTGCSSRGATTADKIVCTMTVTLATSGSANVGIGQMIVDGYGTPNPTVYSPGGAGEARLCVPDLGNAEWFELEVDLTGADSANFYYERGN